ncbi:uncharacterized protein B0I36DRAFT_354284 [Microdochium trichocladiopsis]|uniref:Nephrocystin 3-like N-terminal domain-containing protein n=1 Tax=Microdochium trichocladiopsis TaxID=1682393 RepID=A0A9P9BK12_9PEZI|nr:uncharacterized protein B0I36DRAFT_354284 [Microdochium trichocladiopsis]KAH7017956.1 hypothetical protein B0I36DRAFT_354284 [Microdochium trichocladiopsis]
MAYTKHSQPQQTYQLRNLPADVDRFAAARLLVAAVSDPRLTSDDIDIHSLANTVDWDQKSQNKVATLSFKVIPEMCRSSTVDSYLQPQSREWKLTVPLLSEPLILDTHFEGFTVLNAIQESRHRFDCIALPGLVGHPFGCWQPSEDEPSFMWIRDALPLLMPRTRFLLYGYGAAVLPQKPVGDIFDLARTLMLDLQTGGWSAPTSKPLLFLAHSLGGVILKQMSVLLADGNERAKFILSNIKGVVFFGTPSRGMPVSHLLAVLGSQPNRDMIENLTNQSQVLFDLEAQFSGVSCHAGIQSVWAYETQPSMVTASFGIIVDSDSATSGRSEIDTKAMVQIDKSHWDMIKLGRGDDQIRVWAGRISDLCRNRDECAATAAQLDSSDDDDARSDETELEDDSFTCPTELDQTAFGTKSMLWQYDLFVHSTSTETNQRFSQIEESFEQTFHWAFDDTSIGLTKWLRSGTGIFWISGKPGSGKSTFMKFLLQDPRTMELMHSWRSKHHQIIASFFFHHRGTHLQKSFEGLLQALLGQILAEERGLFPIISSLLDTKLQAILDSKRLGSLAYDARKLLESIAGPAYDQTLSKRLEDLLSIDPAAELDAVLADKCPNLEQDRQLAIKRVLLLAFQNLSNSDEPSSISMSDVISLSNQADRVNIDCLDDAIATWRYKIDYKRIVTEFLQKHKLLAVPTTGDTTSVPFAELEAGVMGANSLRHRKLIKKAVDRQIARQQLRFSIQLSAWSRAELEEAVRQIFDQSLLDLQICLYFDALDEYDGRPETIADFLKDLITTRKSSRTQARVLFSSRP